MGNYTRVHIKFKLRSDTPFDVIRFLKDSLVKDENDERPIYNESYVPIDAPFTKCERWQSFFHGKNFDESIPESRIWQSHVGIWNIEINSEFKNYDSELEKFIEFIAPYIHGRKIKQFFGWYKLDSDVYNNDRYYIHINTITKQSSIS